VFLPPMQSAGALTSLIKIVFGLLISVSFLNKNNCSLSLYHFFVLLPVISSSAVVKHLSKWVELI
jgi:hypothetical protein